jgi:putative ABC transport system substrate-binding protein
MRRREFIAGLGSAAASPLVVRAQQGDRVRRIGVLISGDENDPVAKTSLSAFAQALADLGWTDGRNVRMEVRWTGDGINRIRVLAQELVGLQPDIILAGGTTVTAALQRECAIPSPATSSQGSAGPAGTSPASLSTNPRWEASGFSCSRRSRPG